MGLDRLRFLPGRAWTARLAGLPHFLAALALALQCLVVETHIDRHFASAWAAPAATSQAQAESGLGAGETDKLCPICQAALGGRVGPPTPSFVVPLVVYASEPAAPRNATPDAPLAPAHAWRSRAPPIQL